MAKSTGTTKAVRKGKSRGSGRSTITTDVLFSRVPTEDLEAFGKGALETAASLAGELLAKHQKNQSLISIDTDVIQRGDLPVTLVTVVNDNMPFLYDSVAGAIAESIGEPYYVTHPVVLVERGKSSNKILGLPGTKENKDAVRLSVIQIAVPHISKKKTEALENELADILVNVRAAVADWRPMQARLEQAITDYRFSPPPLKEEVVDEAIAFLEWLRDDNFTFLGMREYNYSGGAKRGSLERTESPGLGILSDPDVRVLRRGSGGVTTTPEIRAFLTGPEPLIVTKANTKSVVHRRSYMDYIGVKIFSREGELTGELRIVGLFTSTAYTRSVLRIPYLRSKADAVIKRLGYSPEDHSGKALLNVIESYPRDELFQIDAKLLAKNADVIQRLGERPRVRALARIDSFERFVSVIVFVPRDRYDSSVREKIAEYLRKAFDGRISAFYPAFPEGGLARVHFIIGRSGGKTPRISNETLEDAIREIVRTWDDDLKKTARATGAKDEHLSIAASMPESYREAFSPDVALSDANTIAGLSEENRIGLCFYRGSDHGSHQAGLKIFHLGAPVELSRRVPLLENMGFRVIAERTHEVPAGGDSTIFIHDMELHSDREAEIDLSDDGALCIELFEAIWRGDADNDGFNALVQTARLSSSQIVILRAYGRYLQQAGVPQSQEFISGTLNRFPEIAQNLYKLFVARFEPGKEADKNRDKSAAKISSSIEDSLQDVPNLDDDQILRRYRNLIESTLRTNAFAPEPENGVGSLAFKLEPKSIEGLPEPRPWREIFVYGPEVEGVHLRFGAVARGGLRWSDRSQDYRTEVLGLVKAQQVKNAVIVPVGAKGGFYPKQLPAGGSRDEVFEAGRAAYINFISSLLSITDNLDGAKVIAPKGVVRHDDDDPYFVVAADKGTATFSDTANGISQDHGFWLDDAFASGGSAGYDHKKMGITARGAWEAVKRHFREMNIDIQSEPFNVVGVGDMSGDVFGNGMLLSEKIRLIAAFDHRDIFIDPDPDPAVTFAERKRLFKLGRSSWQDYDQSKLSKGGIICSRSQKSITLSKAAADAIGLSKTIASPFEIMRAILKSDSDLLWFGGIGTYIRATTESNSDAGDRANDPIRITAPDVGAKVIGEGANLGLTQKARIEFGLNGGRCNSDAIDNSAGVNSSDVEVNIKIALASAMRSGKLKRPARDKLLSAMTDEVADLVLRNNYLQTLSLSQTQRRGLADLAYQSRMMTGLEERGLLDREVEELPDGKTIDERQARGVSLTRAELGVLLAYAKIVLFDDVLATDLPDDAYLEQELTDYFPKRMQKTYARQIADHRLRREIISTVLVNDAINRGGSTFASRLQDLTGASVDAVLRAFVIARDSYELNPLYARIDALDTKIDGSVQNGFYAAVDRLVHSGSIWFLRNPVDGASLSDTIKKYQKARSELEPALPSLVPEFMKAEIEDATNAAIEGGAPDALAKRLGIAITSELIPDIVHVADNAGIGLKPAAKAFFEATEEFRIGRIDAASRGLNTADYYDGLAVGRAREAISIARRDIAVKALSEHGKKASPVAAWIETNGDRLASQRKRVRTLVESGEMSVSRLAVAAGVLADIAGT